MMIITLSKDSKTGRDYEAGLPPSPELMAAMGKFREEMSKSGALLDTGGLLPHAKGARIKAAGGKLSVTDGPFIESEGVEWRLCDPQGEIEAGGDQNG